MTKRKSKQRLCTLQMSALPRQRKTISKVMRESPETLVADLTVLVGKKTTTNLIFHTESPSAWHTALCTKYSKHRKNGKGRQITINKDNDKTARLTVNVYHNNTILAQGSESSLRTFQEDFQSPGEEAKEQLQEALNRPKSMRRWPLQALKTALSLQESSPTSTLSETVYLF